MIRKMKQEWKKGKAMRNIPLLLGVCTAFVLSAFLPLGAKAAETYTEAELEKFYTYTYNAELGGWQIGLTEDFLKALNSSSTPIEYGTGDSDRWYSRSGNAYTPLPNPGVTHEKQKGSDAGRISGVVSMKGLFGGVNMANGTLNLSEFETSDVKDMSEMFWGTVAGEIKFGSGFTTENVTDMSRMFLDTGFPADSYLQALDVSGFDTSNVTNMANMFQGRAGLKTLDISGFDTAKVTDMKYMFYDCAGLRTLNVGSLDTAEVTDMQGMFSGCTALETLDVSGLDTAKVTDMQSMFEWCSSLTALDVSSFDMSAVKGIKAMFYGCKALKSLDVSGWKNVGVTNMQGVFGLCSSLTSLNLTGFQTPDVTNVSSMFAGCESLTNLDLSGFTTENVVSVLADGDGFVNMFKDCKSLETLDLSTFVISDNAKTTNMFSGTCDSAAAPVAGEAKDIATANRFNDAAVINSTKTGINGDKLAFYVFVKYQPGAGSGSMASAALDPDGNVTLSASAFTPPADSHFTQWTDGSKSYQGGESIKRTQHLTLTALYAAHSWGDGTITKEPTETAEGVRTYTCGVCGEKKTETVAKLPAPDPEKTDAGSGNADAKASDTLEGVKIGAAIKSGKQQYKVTDNSKSAPAVTYVKTTDKKAKSIVIPKTVKNNGITYKVTGIDANAFKNNKKLTTVTIGENVTKIGKNAFSGCSALKSVKKGTGVTKIGQGAFANCKKLTSVTLGKKVTEIGQGAFNGCAGLKTIRINSTVLKKVGKNAFKGIHAKATIKVPKAKLGSYRKLLKGKGQKKTVKITK